MRRADATVSKPPALAALIVAVSDELFDTWNPGFGHPAYVDALTRAADAAMDAAAQLGSSA